MSSSPPLAFYGFLDRMRHPSAIDLVRSIKSFIVSFSFQTADSENDSKRLQDFLLTMETTIRYHPLWIGATEAEIDSGVEGLEKFVMTKLFSRTFASTIEDAKCDQEISEKIHLLQNFVRPEHLDIPRVFQNESSWLLAEKELQKINAFKAPREKLLCILNCCRVINNLLLDVSMPADHVPAGADDFLPVLIYVTIKANPPQLHSNLKFIQLYRRQSKLISEAAYYFTNLLSAESFLRSVDAKSLSMDESDFHKSMQEARSLVNEERWIELGTTSAKSESVDSGPTVKYWDKKTKTGGEKYPFMEVEAGELTVGDVEKLLSVYKDVVTKYSRLSTAMRDPSLANEEALTPLQDANFLQQPEAEPSYSIEHNKEDR